MPWLTSAVLSWRQLDSYQLELQLYPRVTNIHLPDAAVTSSTKTLRLMDSTSNSKSENQLDLPPM